VCVSGLAGICGRIGAKRIWRGALFNGKGCVNWRGVLRSETQGGKAGNTVESAFSLLKRGIVRTWHKVSAKHLPAYLDEKRFRFNNRKNQFLFRDTLIKLILSPNLEYKDLTKVT
jgi:ISXO2 transposase-like protein